MTNPRHGVSDLLNLALGTGHFPRRVYRRFRITPWAGKPASPAGPPRWSWPRRPRGQERDPRSETVPGSRADRPSGTENDHGPGPSDEGSGGGAAL